MTPARFKVGDCVTVRYPQQLGAGTVGTVVRVYTAVQRGMMSNSVAMASRCCGAPNSIALSKHSRPIAQTRPQWSSPPIAALPHISIPSRNRPRHLLGSSC